MTVIAVFVYIEVPVILKKYKIPIRKAVITIRDKINKLFDWILSKLGKEEETEEDDDESSIFVLREVIV